MALILDKFASNLDDDLYQTGYEVFKGLYQYECIDRWGKFESAQLPQKNPFYSKTTQGISEQDSENAQVSL